MRQDTLLFLINDEENTILLAMKKRGFGVGKYNGVGGKVIPGESIEEAAVREAHEEVGVVVDEKDLVKAAELVFRFKDKKEWDINCHVFFTRVWQGEPVESGEMFPEWFDRKDIPFERMWVDDKYWLPMVLRGDYVQAEFDFNTDGSELLRYAINGTGRT